MNKHLDVLHWAQRQIDLTCAKFSDKENTAVYFHDFDAMVIGQAYPIPKPTESNGGGLLTITQREGRKKVIDYWMYQGTVMDIHHHPDFVETFVMHTGSMINELTNIEYHAGATFQMAAYEPHQFRCTADAHMTITATKVVR